MRLRDALMRIVRNPRFAGRAGMALARGHYYRIKFRLLGRRVEIGKRFRVIGRLDIKGPGRVIFGDDCSVVSSRIAPTTPYTHAPDAVIEFGNEVMLIGTRLGCQKRIEVGDRSGLADARVMDTDFHQLEVYDTHRSKTSGTSKPVIFRRNTWVGTGAMVLKGVTVGENSVVGAGAVVARDVPPNAVVFGNPARVVWRLRGPSQEKPLSRRGVERAEEVEVLMDGRSAVEQLE